MTNPLRVMVICPLTRKLFSDGINTRHATYEKSVISPPDYSQVAALEVRGPSITSTPMNKHKGGNVDHEVAVNKEPFNINGEKRMER